MQLKLTRALVAVTAFCTLFAASSAAAYVPSEPGTIEERSPVKVSSPKIALRTGIAMMRKEMQRVRSDTFDRLTWPVRGAINTPFTGEHAGIDIEGETGDPIVAAASGRITFAGDDGDGYGTKIVVRHTDVLSTLYSHLSKIKISGGFVERGEVIGFVGCTGSCTGDHLHFEVHRHGVPVNPLGFLRG
jgi:murein DD-endopeptidase MepM/ murein hydrolase activator NlpD